MAVQNAARILKQTEALQDVAYSLLTLKRIQEELLLPEPDIEKITEYLERILVP